MGSVTPSANADGAPTLGATAGVSGGEEACCGGGSERRGGLVLFPGAVLVPPRAPLPLLALPIRLVTLEIVDRGRLRSRYQIPGSGNTLSRAGEQIGAAPERRTKRRLPPLTRGVGGVPRERRARSATASSTCFGTLRRLGRARLLLHETRSTRGRVPDRQATSGLPARPGTRAHVRADRRRSLGADRGPGDRHGAMRRGAPLFRARSA